MATAPRSGRPGRVLIALVSAGIALSFNFSLPGQAAVIAVAEGEEGGAAAANSEGFMTKVVGAAAKGAVAAAVAAMLSAFTEPVVNKLLAARMPLGEAIASTKIEDCLKFFLTTFPTNMLKFPMFEVINIAMTFTSLSGSVAGIVNGLLFCSLMLPVTNYRFKVSIKAPIGGIGDLYQAYTPTVLRDIVYGWARGFGGGLINKLFPSLADGFVGQCALFGLTVWIACLVSAPCNEWRGFWLRPVIKEKGRKNTFSEHFKPEKFLVSTGVGSTVMGISLFVGALLVPPAESFFAYCTANPIVGLLVGAVAVAGVVKVAKS